MKKPYNGVKKSHSEFLKEVKESQKKEETTLIVETVDEIPVEIDQPIEDTSIDPA